MCSAGCVDGSREPLKRPSRAQTGKVEDNPTVARLREENLALRRRIDALSGLPENHQGKQLHELQSVRLTRYTGIYDKDEDGTPEKLIVYLKPIDVQGDIVKAPAKVEVQLWDLDEHAEQTLLQKWAIEPEVLAEKWFATLVTINYRLVFDLPPDVNPTKGGLTVKVKFTDLLSGQVFLEQAPVTTR